MVVCDIINLSRKYLDKYNRLLLRLRGFLLFGNYNVLLSRHVQIPFTKGISFRGGAIIKPNVRLQYSMKSPLTIGNNVKIYDCSVIQSIGGGITIGNNVIIGEYTIIQAQGNVTIEDNVLLASKINFITNAHGYLDVNRPVKEQGNISKSILIKEGAWIGINVTILQGVTIGKNSVVGAGSVVLESIPDYCVAVGIPAKIVKCYDSHRKEWKKYE